MKKLFLLFIFICISLTMFSTNWQDFYRANESEITTFISYNHGKLLSVKTDGILIDMQGNVYQVLTDKSNRLVLYNTGKSTESYNKDNPILLENAILAIALFIAAGVVIIILIKVVYVFL